MTFFPVPFFSQNCSNKDLKTDLLNCDTVLLDLNNLKSKERVKAINPLHKLRSIKFSTRRTISVKCPETQNGKMLIFLNIQLVLNEVMKWGI